MPNQTALIVDDEPHIRELVRLYLGRSGFHCVEAGDGAEALRMFAAQRPALVVLDLMLPGQSGWEVCQTIRAAHDTPVIMLTAKDDDADVIKGLEMGADDYVTKPFNPDELVARVKAVMRRVRPDTLPRRLEFPDFAIDSQAHELIVRGEPATCPPKEFELLWELANHPNQVLSREQLLQRVWDYDYFGDARTVDVHVQRLRRRIEPDPQNPRYIKTVWGVGYKFDPGGAP